MMKLLNIPLLTLLLAGCADLPEDVSPVSNFELERYMGKWYEIARLDHRFERGLEQVTATYSIKEGGTVQVVNRGFSSKNTEWKEAVGKAKFAGDSTIGHLEVSFFGPFYGSYVIFGLDKVDYQYSFVTGSENLLWLLSRTPTVSDELRDKFLTTARELGYKTDALIFVTQE